MVPLVSLLPLFGSTVVKSLVVGHRPGADEWGSFTEKLLTALLVEQAETSATLARIEGKLDELALAPYRNAMAAGHSLLEQAQRDWRGAQDRERLLHEARSRYQDAAAAAQDPYTAEAAEVNLAVTWLLLGSAADAQAILAKTADTLKYVIYDNVLNLKPSLEQQRDVRNQVTPLQRLLGRERETVENALAASVAAAERACKTGVEHLRPVQEARRLLGAAPGDARMPSWSPRKVAHPVIWVTWDP